MPHPPQVLRKEGHHGLPPLPGEGRSLPCSSGADSAASRTDRWVPARMRGPQAGALGWGDCLWKWFLPCTPSYVHVHIVHMYVHTGMWGCVFLPCTPSHVYVHIVHTYVRAGMWHVCSCRAHPVMCMCTQVCGHVCAEAGQAGWRQPATVSVCRCHDPSKVCLQKRLPGSPPKRQTTLSLLFSHSVMFDSL